MSTSFETSVKRISLLFNFLFFLMRIKTASICSLRLLIRPHGRVSVSTWSIDFFSTCLTVRHHVSFSYSSSTLHACSCLESRYFFKYVYRAVWSLLISFIASHLTPPYFYCSQRFESSSTFSADLVASSVLATAPAGLALLLVSILCCRLWQICHHILALTHLSLVQ